MENSNYYELLGVEQTASTAEIRKAFKKAALLHHPDKNIQNRAEAEENFKLITVGYEILVDPDKRASYDRTLRYGRSMESFESFFNKDDLYQNILVKVYQSFDSYLEQLKQNLRLGKMFAEAARKRDWKYADELMRQGALLNELSDEGMSAIHYATFDLDFHNLVMLIKMGANLNNQDGSGNTPLHIATMKCNLDLCHLIISKGGLASLSFQNFENKSPLHVAIELHCTAIANYFATKRSYSGYFQRVGFLDLQDLDGNTPLLLALEKRSFEVAEKLVLAGANVSLENRKRKTAMHFIEHLPPHLQQLVMKSAEKEAFEEQSSSQNSKGCFIM